MRRPAIHRDEGFSLAEVLVTIAIMGITFAAILGGLMTSIRVSDLQRTEATADAVARSAAEWVKDSFKTPYQNCAVVADYSPDLAALPKPSGYSATITRVEYWDGAAPPTTGTYSLSPGPPDHIQPSCSADRGLQRITIVATSSDGQAAETVQIMKRKIS
jgi:prepilin-type N-terminal cleavage/methylation domain-containing protein